MSSSVVLSPKDLKELDRLCSDPFLELGTMVRPEHLKCLENKRANRKVTVILKYPTDQAANKWNGMHEKRIRYGGHMVTAALAALVTWGTGGTAGIWAGTAAGTAAGVLKDEVQAKVWYPKVARGWILIRNYNITYQQFPTKWFEVSWTDVITNHMGQVQEKHTHANTRVDVGGVNGMPEKIARDLISMPSSTKTTIFK